MNDLKNSNESSKIKDHASTEAGERLDVAIALSACHEKQMRRILEVASRQATSTHGCVEGGYETVFLSNLSNLHLFFPCVMEALTPMLTAPTVEARIDALSAGAMLLLMTATSIQKNRASHQSISVPTTAAQWTHGKISDAYLNIAGLILSELERDGAALTETTRLKMKDMLTQALVFGLNEQRGRAENNKLLRRIYDMGEIQLALDMAERFKDFKLLMTITTSLEEDERRRLLDTYKRRYTDDNFELYMCNFYLRNNMTESLLEQRGEKVDAFMSEHDSIRWRRELQTEKYDKAADSLITAASHEEKDLWNQKMYASLAFLSACCADESNAVTARIAAIRKQADDTLTLVSHQERIPLNSLVTMYPDQAQKRKPLSLDELLEVNVFDYDDAQERLEGLSRVLHLLSDLVDREKDAEARNELLERVGTIWQPTFDSRFYQMKKSDEVASTLFGALLNKVQESDYLDTRAKLSILPCSSLLKHGTPDTCTQIVQQRVEMTRLALE